MAVLRGGELAYWGVTAFHETAGEDDVAAAVVARVRKLIVAHRPSVLALEAPPTMRLRASPFLGSITTALEELAREQGLLIRSVAPATIRECLCGSARASHAELVERVVQTYPHLGRCRNSGNPWKDAYWRPMFTAVGVGMVCAAAA